MVRGTHTTLNQRVARERRLRSHPIHADRGRETLPTRDVHTGGIADYGGLGGEWIMEMTEQLEVA